MGEIDRIDRQLAALQARRRQLESNRAALDQVGVTLGAPALPELLPLVHVHRDFGGRGQLCEWLQEVLKAAAPDGLDTPTLLQFAEEKFSMAFPGHKERDRFRKNSLGRALRKLVAQGVTERVHVPRLAGGAVGVWRWKSPATLSEVQAASQEMG